MVDWRPEVVDKLRELAPTGLSAAQIATQINLLYNAGASRNAVIGKLIRCKIPLLGGGRQSRVKRFSSNVPRRPRITNPLGPKTPRTKRMAHPIWSSEPLPDTDREIEKYSLRLSFDALENNLKQCRYMHTLESGHEVYCGNATVLNTAWCERCYRKVYRGPEGSSIQMPVAKVA